MSETAKRLTDALLELPEAERAAIANRLYDSLPVAEDEDSLIAELDRRRAEHESGADPGIPAEEFFTKFREKPGR